MATVGVALRIEPSDRDRWTEIARSEGLNLQQWIRRQCTRAAGSVVGDVVDMSQYDHVEVVGDETAVLGKPSPPKKRVGELCSDCKRKGGGKPLRQCPNGCWDRITKAKYQEPK